MTKEINLALQGGGAHGAFTWGVLDRLLECEELEIRAISGTSAGALNAIALKSGMHSGGRDGAREALRWTWGQVGAITDPNMAQWLDLAAPSAPYLAKSIEYSPAFAAYDVAMRMLSPYQFGVFYKNPLEKIVRSFDYEDVCSEGGVQLFINATNVRSGKIRVFSGDEVSPEAIMASACLPTLYQAVEIEDSKTGEMEAYWDGGYAGNPALWPMFGPEFPPDILVVNINPLYRDKLPCQAQEIMNRVNEISFNASLLRELRAIHFVQRLLDSHKVEDMARLYVHMVSDDDLMNKLSVATKLVPNPIVMAKLFDSGRDAAERFLETHWDRIGVESSLNLPEMFG